MRKTVNQSILSGDDSVNIIAGGDVEFVLQHNFPTALIDNKIEEEIERLRRSRFFRESDTVRASLSLGRRVLEGELAGGTDQVRGRALAWCARLLSRLDRLEKALEFQEVAKTLGTNPEIEIADAIIASESGKKPEALQAMAAINLPASYSASLMTIRHHDGAVRAIQWLNDAGIKAKDLDADGKGSLLSIQLETANWSAAAKMIDTLGASDFNETPILYHLAAITKLLAAVPEEFRAAVLSQVPFDPSGFPLASDLVAMDFRRSAHQLFIDGAIVAHSLNLPQAASIDDGYALWLELMDPIQAVYGRERLEAKLRDLNLGVVHFAISFGVKLDLDAVEREIEKKIATNGGMTLDVAMARFALAATRKSPEDTANYIAKHHKQLAKYIDERLMYILQIEMLARAGSIDSANKLIENLIHEGIPEQQVIRLRQFVAQGDQNYPLEILQEQYEATKSIGDLINLTDGLVMEQRWDEACKYGAVLFDTTHALQDGERLVNVLEKAHRSTEIVDFLTRFSDLIPQSPTMHMSFAWAQYNEGALIESRNLLSQLAEYSETSNYRALHVNLCIAIGDWSALAAYVANEYENRSKRNAQELMRAAQLALHVSSSHSKNLVLAATENASDDASIFAGAYILATTAGWENDFEANDWLRNAVSLSGDGGPLQSMSLKDILQEKPEWDRRESETWSLLGSGSIPIFMAAKSLNRSITDLTIFPALANLSEIDPRRRSAIPAYSGCREQGLLDITGKIIGIDATALLTLALLNVLDEAIDAVQAIVIPHSTLSWLFEEKQRVAFHQPSRIKNAHKIRDFLATEKLEKFVPSTKASSDLTTQIGDELAALIAEAEKSLESDTSPSLVVRSSPVHRISTLIEEEADLSSHYSVLSSCLAVVYKLRDKSQATAYEVKRAEIYLQLQERPWPNQPKISDGATLYLDGLSIIYLQHLGMLGKLKAAGLRAVASRTAVDQANALIAYENNAKDVMDCIERMRASLNSGIESGKIKLSRRISSNEEYEESVLNHPTVAIIALASVCDAAISDDRFINQHENIDDGNRQTMVFSSLELLNALESVNAISKTELLEIRTKIRRAGYFFVPVDEEELECCLLSSRVECGKIVESTELKAIRESILRVRMTDWLQLPREAPWLDTILRLYTRVLKSLWVDDVELIEANARSNWIVDQIDIRGWAHRLNFGDEEVDILNRRCLQILLLLTPPSAGNEAVDSYWSWLEENVLVPLKEQNIKIFEMLVDYKIKIIAEVAEMEFTAESLS